MKRLHLHVVVDSLARAVGFYSGLFGARPCCAGATYANWRIDEPPVNFAASQTDRPRGIAHFGLEVETPAELTAIDRALGDRHRVAGDVPWEVSVRQQRIRQRESAA